MTREQITELMDDAKGVVVVNAADVEVSDVGMVYAKRRTAEIEAAIVGDTPSHKPLDLWAEGTETSPVIRRSLESFAKQIRADVQKQDDRRLCIVRLSIGDVLDWFFKAVTASRRDVQMRLRHPGLPADIRVIGVRENFYCRTLDFCVQHPSFAVVADGDVIPPLDGCPGDVRCEWEATTAQLPPGWEWSLDERHEPIIVKSAK